MQLFEFYGNALNSHKRSIDKLNGNLAKFDINQLLKRDQFKTINELSGGKGVTNWSSVKGSVRVKTTYTAATRSCKTLFKLHKNVIFQFTELRGYAIVLGDSKLWQSATTKRHINYLLKLLLIPFKYVTINDEPYLIGTLNNNSNIQKRLSLNTTYYLNDL